MVAACKNNKINPHSLELGCCTWPYIASSVVSGDDEDGCRKFASCSEWPELNLALAIFADFSLLFVKLYNFQRLSSIRNHLWLFTLLPPHDNNTHWWLYFNTSRYYGVGLLLLPYPFTVSNDFKSSIRKWLHLWMNGGCHPSSCHLPLSLAFPNAVRVTVRTLRMKERSCAQPIAIADKWAGKSRKFRVPSRNCRLGEQFITWSNIICLFT